MTEQILSYIYWLIAFAAIVILLWALIEPRLLDTTAVSLPPDANVNKSKFPGLKIVLISDLHTEYIFIRPERVIREIERFKPDAVIFAGDWCASSRQGAIRRMEIWLKMLCDATDKLGIPLFAVPGNHDGPDIISKIEHSGCRLILDSDQTLTDQSDRDWRLTGIVNFRNTQRAFSRLKNEIPFERHVVIAHNPDAVLSLKPDQGRYFLCGHFHGGQIWAPFHLEFRVLRGEKMASMGYHRGAFRWDTHWGYISRGLGCVLLPFRFLSRPELTKLTLTADDDEKQNQSKEETTEEQQ